MFMLLSAALAQDTMSLDAGLDLEVIEATHHAFVERWLVVEVQAPEVELTDRRQPTHLSLVLDTSGSMKERGKLEYARAAAASLVERLGPGDTLSLIGFGSEPKLVRRQGRILNPAEVVYTIGLLTPQGGTHLYGGLQQGLEQLQRFLEHPRRRVLLLSDGEATAGPTDRRTLAGLAYDAQQSGVTVSTVGLGLEFDAPTLIAIADAGGGFYQYGNDPEAIAQLFDREIEAMQQVAALGATVDLKLAPGTELIEVLGYEEFDGKAIAGGWRVLLGDMRSAEPRKIVARVRVDATRQGEQEVLKLDMAWRDPDTGQVGRKDGQVQVQVGGAPPPPAAAEDSQRRRSKVAAASAGKALERATALEEQGRNEEAVQVLDETLIEFEDLLIEGELLDAGESIQFYRDQLVEPEAAEEEERRARDANRLKALGYMY